MHRFLFAAMLCSLTASAHEIGTSRVAVLLRDGRTYDVEIVTDATALAEKLEAVGGGQLSNGLQAAQLQKLIAGYEDRFRQRMRLAFDDQPVEPVISYSVVPAEDASSAAAATIHLVGLIPPGARSFTWKFAWTFASYALTVRTDAAENPTTQWLEGSQTSAPFALNTAAPSINRIRTALRYLTLGFTHIMPNGIDHMLFVLGIYLLSNRAKTVLWQVSAFTLAHSLTLALSLYGVVHLPSAVVEPIIAGELYAQHRIDTDRDAMSGQFFPPRGGVALGAGDQNMHGFPL